MSVPTYDKFIEPVLRYLAARPEGALARDVHEGAAEALSLTETDRQQSVPSGVQLVYKNRTSWAHDRLKRAGLSASFRRGYWKLTEDGIAFAREHPSPLSEIQVEHLAIGYMDVRLGQRKEIGATSAFTLDRSGAFAALASSSPDDRLGEALQEIRQSVTAEVLEALRGSSPSFFEFIVLDVLHAMGYGASAESMKRIGGTADGGVDGVISLDKLGLEKVYVQAKRWRDVVGRPEIQGFYGALAGQRANKGVFITTSTFTMQAREFASSVERIVLVDGQQLAGYMIDHEVGVTSRSIRVPKIDSDYFDEESG